MIGRPEKHTTHHNLSKASSGTIHHRSLQSIPRTAARRWMTRVADVNGRTGAICWQQSGCVSVICCPQPSEPHPPSGSRSPSCCHTTRRSSPWSCRSPGRHSQDRQTLRAPMISHPSIASSVGIVALCTHHSEHGKEANHRIIIPLKTSTLLPIHLRALLSSMARCDHTIAIGCTPLTLSPSTTDAVGTAGSVQE